MDNKVTRRAVLGTIAGGLAATSAVLYVVRRGGAKEAVLGAYDAV